MNTTIEEHVKEFLERNGLPAGVRAEDMGAVVGLRRSLLVIDMRGGAWLPVAHALHAQDDAAARVDAAYKLLQNHHDERIQGAAVMGTDRDGLLAVQVWEKKKGPAEG